MPVYDRIKAPIVSGATSSIISISGIGSDGFRSPNGIIASGATNIIPYLIEANGEWEIGQGYKTSPSSGSGSFLRQTVFSNSLGTTALIDSTDGDFSIVLTQNEMSNYSNADTPYFEKAYTEKQSSRTNNSGTISIDPTIHGNIQYLRPAGNITIDGFADGGVPEGRNVVLLIDQVAAAYTVTWSGSGIEWISGVAPTLGVGAKHVIVVFNLETSSGYRYDAAYVGQLS